MGKIGLLLFSVIVLSMGYHLYVPTPPDLQNSWRERLLTLAVDTIEAGAYLVARFTGEHPAIYMSRWSEILKWSIYHHYPEVEVRDTRLSGVNVRVYRRQGFPGSIPAVLFFHGGGWIHGNRDAYDGVSVRLALMTNMTVVSVDYRKPPAHPYPIPFQDCLHAALHVLKHGDQLGVDSKQVFLAGDSAGGNLAAAVALKLSYEDPSVVPPIKAQVLIAPVLQVMTFNNPSYIQTPPIVISRERMVMFWTAYMGIPFTERTTSAMLNDRHVSTDVQKSKYGYYAGKSQSVEVKAEYDVEVARRLDSLVLDPFLAPLMADEDLLRQAPPTYLMVCEYDPLRDEAILLADRLKGSGVDTEVRELKGQAHPVLPMINYHLLIDYHRDQERLVAHAATYIVGKAQNS